MPRSEVIVDGQVIDPGHLVIAMSVDKVYEALKHGDENHRKWLLEALCCLALGKPLPAPY